MPKASSSTSRAGKLEPFTIKHLTRTILVPRPRTYQAAVSLVHKHFALLRYKTLCFQTTQVDIAAGNAVELTDDAWEGIIDSITTVEVLKAEEGEGSESFGLLSPYRYMEESKTRSECLPSSSPPSGNPLPEEPYVAFRVRGFMAGSTDVIVKARSTDKWDRLVKDWCSVNHFKDAHTLYVVLKGSNKPLEEEIGLEHEDTFDGRLVELHKQQNCTKSAAKRADSESQYETETETPSEHLPSPSPPPPDPTDGRIATFSVWAPVDGTNSVTVKAKPSDTWARLVKAWCWTNHYKRGDALRISHDGNPLSRHAKIGWDPIFADETQEIVLLPEQKGGKPVIYIWTPQPQVVSVHLKLSRQWRFSAMYPVASIASEKIGPATIGESIRWDVQTCSDGNLIDKKTGLEVNSLFWEAATTPAYEYPDSPPSSRPGTPGDQDAFNPTTANLTDQDSVLLCVSDMTGYLDTCLRALGLHTEARTSFITYWLPSFLQHEYVALCFVPQASYASAARLTLAPAPDVVARIFMLFKGVAPDALDVWTQAAARAREDVGLWREVVGLGDAAQMRDWSLFRILEWGGMEVLI